MMDSDKDFEMEQSIWTRKSMWNGSGPESKSTDSDSRHSSTVEESDSKISFLSVRPPSPPRFPFTGTPSVFTPTDLEDVTEYSDQFIKK